MSNRMVHLRIPQKLYDYSMQLVEEKGFGSIQEFARHALRQAVELSEQQAAIEKIKKLKGSVKAKRVNLAEKERKKIAEGFLKKDQSKIFGKYGLD